jgi:hypothetical protein
VAKKMRTKLKKEGRKGRTKKINKNKIRLTDGKTKVRMLVFVLLRKDTIM